MPTLGPGLRRGERGGWPAAVLPDAGRDPCPPWAPASAGVSGEGGPLPLLPTQVGIHARPGPGLRRGERGGWPAAARPDAGRDPRPRWAPASAGGERERVARCRSSRRRSGPMPALGPGLRRGERGRVARCRSSRRRSGSMPHSAARADAGLQRAEVLLPPEGEVAAAKRLTEGGSRWSEEPRGRHDACRRPASVVKAPRFRCPGPGRGETGMRCGRLRRSMPRLPPQL